MTDRYLSPIPMKTSPLYIVRHIITCSYLTLSIASVQAQIQPDLSTPHASLQTHLHYLQPDHYEPQNSALTIPGEDVLEDKIRTAQQIKRIYDGKGLYVSMQYVPKEPTFRDSMSNRFVFTPFPDELPQIYLERQGKRWLYSSESIASLEELYRDAFPYGTHLLMDAFARQGSRKYLGLYPWQYAGILIVILAALFLYLLLDRIIKVIVMRVARRFMDLSVKSQKALRSIHRLLSLLICVAMLRLVLPLLALPARSLAGIFTLLKVASIILLVMITLRVIDIVRHYLEGLADQTSNRMDDQSLPLLSKMAKILVVILGVMAVLDSFDVNVTALVAGVGLGGLAIALAAQDTVKNLLGSFMIFIDRPFQVGDYIVGSNYEGTVREVGFRTTRIEKTDTAIIAVPNGVIVNDAITNLGMRRQRLYSINLDVDYDTSPEDMQRFTRRIRAYLDTLEQVDLPKTLVRFTALKESALNVLVRIHFHSDSYDDELASRESINLEILKIAKEVGVDLTFPTQTLKIKP